MVKYNLDDKTLNRVGSLLSIVGFVFTGSDFLKRMSIPPYSLNFISDTHRLYVLLFLGLVAAIAHAVLWTLAEKTFDWQFGGGGGKVLPKGWQAVTLSITLTLPLVIVPPAYQLFTNDHIVLPHHFLAGGIMILTAACGHILLYGSRILNFAGIKNIIMPLRSSLNIRRALFMEFLYAFIHFSTIVLPYQIIVRIQYGSLDSSLLINTLISALVFFFGACICISIRYPESLRDPSWIQVRGVINGLILMVALTGGMLI